MRALRSADEGFSLIEVAISSMVVVVFFLAFAGSLETATDSTALSRTHTQAAGVLSQELEFARSLQWSELAMSSVETMAPLLDEFGSALSADLSGLAQDEPLVVDAAGRLTSRVQHSSENTEYTVWRYVTDAGDGLRRVVVLVEWDLSGQTRHLRSSTLVSEYSAVGHGTGTTTTTSVGA